MMKAFAFLCFGMLLGVCVWPASATDDVQLGSMFKDCPVCAEMVVIPPGSFVMGEDAHPRERPAHRVNIAHSFAVGKYDVTFAEWDACARDGGCSGPHDDYGWGRGTRPMINASWNDAQSYVNWLSDKTGKHYRLLSEAEWEYVARAGTTTKYWWGNDLGAGNANCNDCGDQWHGKWTSPVGSFKPNLFGLFDTTGNVAVWVQDNWHDNYEGAPQDGQPWQPGDPERRVLRDGSFAYGESHQHVTYRNGDAPDAHKPYIGFRVARDLQGR